MAKTVYAVGDCSAAQAGGSSINKSCKALVPAAGSLDEFWFLGDVYQDGTAAEFSNDFDPLWGAYKTAGKMKSTPGNHGWANHTTGFDPYHAALITSWGGKRYGSYTLGDWLVIWINSMEGASTAVSPVPESSIVLGQASGPAHDMLVWLQGVFTANPGTNKILVCHHNVWGSGGHGDVSQMQPLWNLLPGNVAVLLTGHTHNMEVHQPRNKAGAAVAFNGGDGVSGAGATIAVVDALAGNTDALAAGYTPALTYGSATSPAKAGVLKILLSDSGLAHPTADLTFLHTDGTSSVIPTITANTSGGGGGGGTPPANTSLPNVSDTTPTVGELLTTGGGTWTGSPTPTLTYQWQVSPTGAGSWTSATGVGATTSSYTVASGDLGKFLRVQVVGTNAAGSATANSSATSAVAAAPTVPVLTAQPVLTDTSGSLVPTVNDVYSTTHGTWSGSPTSYAYTWEHRDPSVGMVSTIAGATASTYQLASSDLGMQVRSSVIATNGSGPSDPAPSAWTATVSAGSGGGGGGGVLQPGVTESGGVYTVQVVVSTSAVGLAATVDEQNARVQLLATATGMQSLSITRQHPSGLVWPVRGITNAPTAGDTFLAYDYELPIGRECVYVADAFDGSGASLGLSDPAPVLWPTQQDYLKDPALPARNMPVMVSAMAQGDFTAPLAVLPVIGRPAPVTLGDVRQAQTGDLQIITLSIDEALRLHQLTASGHVLLLQSTPDSEVGNMYIALSKVSEQRLSPLRDEPARLWTLTYQETDPPVGGISGGFVTYQTVLDNEDSYASLLADFDSYLSVLEGIGAGLASSGTQIVWRGE